MIRNALENSWRCIIVINPSFFKLSCMTYFTQLIRSNVRLNIFIVGLFYAFSPVTPLLSQNLSSKAIHAIDSVCEHQLVAGNYVGLAVSIASKDNSVWSKGYGYSNLENKVQVDPKDDLFRIGSVSKPVTASALARLVEQGKLDLDAPISKYMDDLPADKANLTLRQLAGHLGGIRHYRGLEFFSNVRYQNVIEPLGVFINDTLLCEPGTKFNYSTYAWTLISAVMESALEKPFLSIIEQEVSNPLQLTDLKGDHTDSTRYQRVQFYQFQNGNHVLSPPVDNSNKWAGGGLICSAEDIAKYGYAHVGPGYLKEETLAEFTRGQKTNSGENTNYGIGFRSGTDKNERTWFGHSGGSVGGSSMMLIYPQEDLVVVTLVNQSGADMGELAMRIADLVLGMRE